MQCTSQCKAECYSIKDNDVGSVIDATVMFLFSRDGLLCIESQMHSTLSDM